MIGLIPCFLQALKCSTAPFITPWSVRPSAGCPSEAARSASASIGQAPSRTEYSEWTWRWAKLIRVPSIRPRPDGFGPPARTIPLVAVGIGRGDHDRLGALRDRAVH